jgi:hypothetical protein
MRNTDSGSPEKRKIAWLWRNGHFPCLRIHLVCGSWLVWAVTVVASADNTSELLGSLTFILPT